MIYEEKTVKKTLVEDFNLYQKVIDALPLPISYRDRNGVYQTCNTAYEKMTGITREKMVGRTPLMFMTPKSPKLLSTGMPNFWN